MDDIIIKNQNNITTVANEKFIFVKMQGASDSEQVCGYYGNRVECAVAATMPAFWDKDGDGNIDPGHVTFSYEDSIIGPYYNDSYNMAAKNFYDYRNGAWNFNGEYRMTQFSLNLLKPEDGSAGGITARIGIPLTEMPFLLPNT